MTSRSAISAALSRRITPEGGLPSVFVTQWQWEQEQRARLAMERQRQQNYLEQPYGPDDAVPPAPPESRLRRVWDCIRGKR